MDRSELLRLVETLHKDKEIDKEIVFQGIEAALMSAARKHSPSGEAISIKIDRTTGELIAQEGDRRIDPAELGRISAQAAKQIIIQKIREAERDVLYDDFINRKGTIVTGAVQRFEGSTIVVSLGKAEGVLHRAEQISEEVYRPGDRIRALLLDVKKVGQRVKIILSRSHPDFIRRLFELEVPEIAEKVIEIKAIAREAGYRTKIAVVSRDAHIDCVGTCVGVRGTRIKHIVDELGGEKIDIIRWDEAPEVLIPNTLKPAEITGIMISPETHQTTVVVPEDQLSLAIGKRGQNVRLAAKLTGWDIDILTEGEFAQKEAQQPQEGAPEQTPSEQEEEVAASSPKNKVEDKEHDED